MRAIPVDQAIWRRRFFLEITFRLYTAILLENAVFMFDHCPRDCGLNICQVMIRCGHIFGLGLFGAMII